MNFNRRSLMLVALLAAGCSGGGGGDNNPSTSGARTAFAPFIKAQLTQTSDTSEPTDVNDRQFEFDENETSFDDVLQ